MSQVALLTQRAKSQSVSTFGEKYNLSKKLYATIKKECDNRFYLRFEMLQFIRKLLSYQHFITINKKIRKSEIKCLLALMQFHVEYKKFFDSNSILELVDSINSLSADENSNKINFKEYETELFYQWLEIYYDPNECINEILDSFPCVLFGYNLKSEFLNDHLSDIICFYCSRNNTNEREDFRVEKICEELALLMKTPLIKNVDSNSNWKTILTEQKFGAEFCAKLFCYNNLNKNKNFMEKMLKNNLVSIDILKRYFHSIFKNFFLNSNIKMKENNSSADFYEIKNSILNATDLLLKVFTNSKVKEKISS
jgi:hypothetical protein